MDVVALSEVTRALALIQVQGDVEAGLKLVGVGIAAGTAVIGPGRGWATSSGRP